MNLNSLILFFNKASTKYIKVDVEKLKFPEFRLLATAINKMIGERNKAYNDLLLEKAYFEELFQSSPEAIAIADNDSKLIRINKKFIDLFGYTSQEVLTKHIDNLIVPENIRKEAEKITREVSRGKVTFNETIRKHKNGKLINVSIFCAPVKIKDGQVAIYAIYRDISKQKEYESSLKEAKEKAEKAVKFQTSFLANLSHEIRTPMNAIVGFTNLLDKVDNVQTRDKYIKLINDNSMSLLNIIEDILDVSKIEAGQLKLNFAKCYVNEVLLELYKSFHEKITKNNKVIKLFFKTSSKEIDIIISIDVIKFKQIFSNLISNAIKFTEKGYVEFGYNLEQDNIVFYVKDTGIGIPKEQHEIIFDRFRKIENNNAVLYGGTGLGLAITKKLVEMLNGEIWLESEPDKGSTFYFTLPKSNL